MGNRTKGPRVLGPYELIKGKRWQVLCVEGNLKVPSYFHSEKEAKEAASILRRQLKLEQTVDSWIDQWSRQLTVLPETKEDYLRHLEVLKGKEIGRIRAPLLLTLVEVNGTVATRRMRLKVMKMFCRWLEKQGVIPWKASWEIQQLRVLGISNRGKPQLTLDESKKYLTACLSYKDEKVGTVAAIPLLMNVRASEIVKRVVRDIDGAGSLYRIPKSKSPRGARVLSIPSCLQERILSFTEGKEPDDSLFNVTRNQIYHWVRQICQVAGVPLVCTHSLRGTHSSLAEEAGETPLAVARALGHEDPRTTVGHYTLPSVRDNARISKVEHIFFGPN